MSNDQNTSQFLSKEEENKLIEEYKKTGCPKAESILVNSYMHLIENIEKSLRGYRMDSDDMIQEGVIAFINNLKKFEPERGYVLATFITRHVKNAMLDYIFKNNSIVRTITTKNHKKAFFNLSKYKDSKGHISHENCVKFANDFDMTMNQAKDAINRMHIGYDPILSTGTTTQNDFDDGYVHDLENPISSPEDIITNAQFEYVSTKALYEALETLKDRERDIVSKRWLEEDSCSLADLSKIYQVSPERVRQIESQAITRISKYMKENYEF